MKAFLIVPATESIDVVDIDSVEDIKAMIGFDTIDSDEIGPDGDRLILMKSVLSVEMR